MATVDDFTAIMGEIKEVNLEEGKQRFDKDETIKRMEDFDGNYGKRRFVLYCESGNVYSTFITPPKIEDIHHRHAVGDTVMVTYTENMGKDKEGNPKLFTNLEGITEKARKLDDDMGPQQPVLEPESRPTPIASPEPPPGKGKGTPKPPAPLEAPLTAGEERMESGSIGRNVWVVLAAEIGAGFWDSSEQVDNRARELWGLAKALYRIKF